MLRCSAWQVPPIFRFIQERGSIAPDEMFRAFNMGIGLIVACEAADRDAALYTLEGGARLVVERDPTNPIVSIRAVWLGGLRAETEDLRGAVELAVRNPQRSPAMRSTSSR